MDGPGFEERGEGWGEGRVLAESLILPSSQRKLGSSAFSSCLTPPQASPFSVGHP